MEKKSYRLMAKWEDGFSQIGKGGYENKEEAVQDANWWIPRCSEKLEWIGVEEDGVIVHKVRKEAE